MKKARELLLGFALGYASLELASLGGLLLLRLLKPEYFPTELTRRFERLDTDHIREFRDREYHPDLGWDYRPGRRTERENCAGEVWTATYAEDGSRSDPLPHDRVLVATYGDSFTHGSEVDDDETWQHLLAERLGGAVKNFGVGGYGPLQALLKLEAHLVEGAAPPIVVLGIHERNIDRAVNLYRPFLFPKTSGTLAFKPAVRCPSLDCAVKANPLRELAMDVEALRSLAERLREVDYWETRKTPIAYSYFVTLVRLGVEKVGETWSGRTLWLEPEGMAAMEFLLARFERTVREVGSIPIVLLYPSMDYLEKRESPSYTSFVRRLSRQREDLLLVDLAKAEFDPARFTVKPYECHTSVYGHRVIAALMGDLIETALPDPVDGLTPAP